MSETDNKPTLGRKPLGIKRAVEAGEVKQTFSHGRTNKVVVEVKRRKVLGRPGDAAEVKPEPAAVAPEPVAVAPAPPPPAPAPVRRPAPSNETPQERVARLQREAEEDRLRFFKGLARHTDPRAAPRGTRVNIRQYHAGTIRPGRRNGQAHQRVTRGDGAGEDACPLRLVTGTTGALLGSVGTYAIIVRNPHRRPPR
jgi:hypothetical protein